MHSLPPLITGSHRYQLPLVDRTAAHLVGSLLERDLQRRRFAFRAALAADPVLALWALVLATAEPEHVTSHLDGLAGWLAAEPLERFRGIAIDPSEPEHEAALVEFCEPAGCALATAELAEHLALAARGSGPRAYLLGLVLTAPQWLGEVSAAGGPATVNSAGMSLPGANVADMNSPEEGNVLPSWLLRDLEQIGQSRAEQSLEVACVSQARVTVVSRCADEWRALECAPEQWIGRWQTRGTAWASGGPWPLRLAALVEQLLVAERSTRQFEHELETAKLEAVKEFAYGAGHEINNPLANISARAQTLLVDESDPERRRTLAAINAQAFRGHEMIADMMLFARPPEPKWQAVELEPLAKNVCGELQRSAEEQETELRLRLPDEPVVIEADPIQLAVALRSLCVNALEALVSGGHVQVELVGPTAESPRVRLEVSDDGPGISAAVRPKIFEPYFSGREAGRGLGLGLSKCWRIVTMHGGSIEVAERPPRGVRFTIELPIAQTR